MKIKKQKLLKKENGITLVALITTIIVLSIVSTPLIFGTNNITEYRKFSKFKNDLLNLKEAVSNVYSTDKELSSDSNRITNAKFVSKHAKFVNTINNYGSRFIHFDDYSKKQFLYWKIYIII